MGWSLSWIAVRGGTRDAVCSAIGLQPTGQKEEEPESDIVCTDLPAGWFLVLFNREELANDVLKSLSKTGEVVYCFVEDHVMYSTAASWSNGKQNWRVSHDGQDETRLDLKVEGEPPAEFERIRKKLFAEQEAAGDDADVDYVYDLPAELAKHVVGFRHDQDTPGMSGQVFEVLERVKKLSTLGNFFGSLLGRKTQ
jgi:hypothetical protein